MRKKVQMWAGHHRPCRPINVAVISFDWGGEWANKEGNSQVQKGKEKTTSGACRYTEGRGPAWEGIDDPSPSGRLKKMDHKPSSSFRAKSTRGIKGR